MKAKQFIWILLPLMLLQSFSTVWLWSIFELNRDYIARYECINRFNEKALSCRGQCILMKKMREHEEKEQKNLESRIIDVVFINNTQNFDFKISSLFQEDAAERPFPEYNENYSYRPIFTIFHPPLV
ncbi:hypothetical protein D7322_11290 [Sphingobacterium puteale]|uniref:Uncharacterized protein n=2 Tax=Sphingobacterium TaxID=28453 RepID=A0A363NMU2_9SPHI|nr:MULTISPECIES: hypothetical protein [Sphingobacterium]PUV22102.1 hypothetical protein DCO56_24560 [Sphingobacterium athyrii]QIH31758.1 hypothetical protein G6053_02020 [Sphingobacterium sp. DR205]RKO71342.1 hypothetical protein D7322_11290 [Sphingobacterium puteale]